MSKKICVWCGSSRGKLITNEKGEIYHKRCLREEKMVEARYQQIRQREFARELVKEEI